MLAEIRAGIQGRDCGERFWESEEDTAIYEASYVCDEDLLGDVPPRVAEGFEDAARL